MGRPRKEDSGDTREKILRAALEQFAQNSFHGTSMREVAKAVGVRESALYHYFDSKDAILAALIERHGPGRALVLTHFDHFELLRTGLEPYLRQIAGQLFDIWYDPTDAQFARVMMSEGIRKGLPEKSAPRQAITKAYAQVKEIFQSLIADRVIRRGNADAYVLEFMGPLLMMRLFHQLLKTRPTPRAELDPLLDAHVENFWRMVGPPK